MLKVVYPESQLSWQEQVSYRCNTRAFSSHRILEFFELAEKARIAGGSAKRGLGLLDDPLQPSSRHLWLNSAMHAVESAVIEVHLCLAPPPSDASFKGLNFGARIRPIIMSLVANPVTKLIQKKLMYIMREKNKL